MRRLIAPKEMLSCEKAYFAESGVASIDVMERAALALAEAVSRRLPHAQSVYFACGPGGNGGDGYACARLMHNRGINVKIFEVCEPKHGDALENRRRAVELGIEINPDTGAVPDAWVDCLYGTGLSRAPEGVSAGLIRRMNASGAMILSADIPSGLNGETGEAYDPCVKADMTVTFQHGKFGHYLQDGLDMCGEIITADVGFPAEAFPEKLPMLFEPEDIRACIAGRKRNIHKGKCGHVLIAAGSAGMAGAAVLCAKAALRSGAGLVTVACAERIMPIIQASAPCAMCIPLPEENGAIAAAAAPILKEALKGKTAFAIGPGLSRRAAPEAISVMLESGLPGVIDADALNIISENAGLRAMLGPRHVITPHPGEAARLLGRKCCNPLADGMALAESGATAVLKGASRVICGGGDVFISASGSGCMARGGSGDIFTGILGTLLAENASTPAWTAAAACEIHGLCGMAAEDRYGLRAANAGDLIEFLPEVWKKHV